MIHTNIRCWEPTSADAPILEKARKLYEETIDQDERIDWSWIARAVSERNSRRASSWAKHLILASEGPVRDHPSTLMGLAYGAHISGFGGYLCYLSVAAAARRNGIASRLLDSIHQTFLLDAFLAGETLPFIIWESYRPTPDEPAEFHDLWTARVKTFDRAGAYWIDGVELITPNYSSPDPGAKVPLQLFLQPVHESIDHLNSRRLSEIVTTLLDQVYHERPGDHYYEQTCSQMKPQLRLRKATSALLTSLLV